MNERIDDEALDGPIVGRNLNGGTLRENLAGGATLLAFLRHLG